MIMISAAELDLLKSKADAGEKAFQELTETRIKNDVNGMVFTEKNKDGRFLPKTTEKLEKFMKTLNPQQYSEFKAIVEELPKKNIFGEVGKQEASDTSAQNLIEQKVTAAMKEDKALTYSEALKVVLDENPELQERYNEEIGA